MKLLDLPYFLRTLGGYKRNVQVIGIVQEEIEAPTHLDWVRISEKSNYISIDLIGLILDDGTRYRVKGRIAALVNSYIVRKSRQSSNGRGVYLFKGGVNLARDSESFIQMIRISKDQGVWQGYNIGVDLDILYNSNSYNDYVSIIDDIIRNGYDFSRGLNIPDGYLEACEGYEFVYKQDFESKVSDDFVMRDIGVGKLPDLGVSDVSNIDSILENKFNAEEVRVKTNIFKVENRDTILEKSKNIDEMEKSISVANEKVNNMVDLAMECAGGYSIEDDIQFCGRQLIAFWNRRVDNVGSTGKGLFKEILGRVLPDFKVKGSNNLSPIDMLLGIKKEQVIEKWVSGDLGYNEEDNLLIKIVENRLEIYIKIIDLLLGVNNRLFNVFLENSSANDLYSIMKTNPYYLGIFDSRVKVEDLDKLAMLYGVDLNDKDIIKLRNIVFMHNHMLDSNNKHIADNTALLYVNLVNNVRVGYTLYGVNYNYLQQTGYILSDIRMVDLKYYVNKEINFNNFRLPKEGWRKLGVKYFLGIPGNDHFKAVQDYVDSGLGVIYNIGEQKFIADFVFINKEMFIYNRLYELSKGMDTREITDSEIEQCIKSFESKKARELNISDFKLETKQADAVRLIRNPIMLLTGPAGSGKTTTAEALVYGVETLLGIPEESIMFCAPTGKAADRLKEIVKRKTRTIHSLFGIGGESFSLKNSEEVNKKDDIKVLIIDESSMINLDLMYNLMLKIEEARIFFLGDKEQLPPIGFGKPFANLMKFLPCVVLDVTKRASDSSGITRNAKSIIYDSDVIDVVDLVDTNDFRLIEADKDNVVDTVLDVCKYHLGQNNVGNFRSLDLGVLDKDDIQVITPVNKNPWGTINLNIQLHNIFNPIISDSDSYIVFLRPNNTEIEFRVGDRVIHTKNFADRTRLFKTGKNSFDIYDSNGIMNGAMGKIEGIYTANELDFEGSNSEKDLKSEFRGTDNVMFLAVAYTDVGEHDVREDFIILYRFEIFKKNGNRIDVISNELVHLDLAYALSVHKVQGSQAKLVVCVMMPTKMEGFISRNMIYTAITRAEKGCYLIGDVKGRYSCVSKGRKHEQTSKRMTTIDHI